MSKWLVLCVLATTACFTTDLDPNAEGAFACSVDDDCPESQECDGLRCLDPEDVPVMRILSPEPDPPQVFPVADFPANGQIEIRFQGNLSFAESPDDTTPGSGFVQLIVDGAMQEVRMGPLSGGIAVTATIDPTPGPHRIAVKAVRPNGVPYGGPQSTATALFWIDDGEPAVAIVDPWPGAEFPLGTPTVDVSIATLNFTMREAEMMRLEGIGHGHVYYDDIFPACADDPMCDPGYLTIVNPPRGTTDDIASAPIVLPESAATTATLTAVLRNDDHSPYRFPFGDPMGRLVLDTIVINRVGE